jgi:hypothetical protein
MNRTCKRNTILLALLAAGAAVLAASGLPELVFYPGMPFPKLLPSGGTISSEPGSQLATTTISDLMKAVFLILAVLVFVFAMYKAVRVLQWRNFRSIGFFILLGSVGFTGVIMFIIHLIPVTMVDPAVKFMKPPVTPPRVSAPVGDIPRILLWIIGSVLVVLVCVILFLVLNSRRKVSASQGIEIQAKKAREDILSGRDLKEVISRCYFNMSDVLKRDNGIEREDSMTVEEFARVLEKMGTPRESVGSLTRLFEAVRYGRWEPHPGDEGIALRCLDEIIRHFSAVRGGKAHG